MADGAGSKVEPRHVRTRGEIIEAIGSEMPGFGGITFTEATAGTKSHTINLQHAFTVAATNGPKRLTSARVNSAQGEVVVSWDAAIRAVQRNRTARLCVACPITPSSS